MPRNCSTDFQKAMRLLETKLANAKDETAKNKIKARFGLGGLEDDDFGWALIDGFQTWQGTQFTTPYEDNNLYNMCDYIEGVPDRNKAGLPLPDENGVGACKALKGLATWLREVHIPGTCADKYWSDPNTIACWDLHNTSSPLFTDRSSRNIWGIQWQWFCCNEPFQQWQASAPGDTGLIPRFLTMQDLRDQCGRFFPDEDGYTYGLKAGRTTDDIVKLTGGWDFVNTTRLLYTNGEYDPWLMETVSSPYRPGGPLESTNQVPIFVIPKAAHCSDLVSANIRANADLTKAFSEILVIMKKWVAYYDELSV
ncbi:hypothetical protein Golomagni_06593 [Golovinomyces magnicellulatus]|nr:hypothetical protein Golomagni_06593 [Golovinomyces magnicellulatus]